MKENKYFPYLVAISAISISFSAAFYSIFGIGKMFAGASTNVMIMASSLEFAKLVIASLLYRFWEDINLTLKIYLTLACFILILITSAGIYGFLSSAYQETATKVENIDKNTSVLEKKKQMIQKQLDQAEKQLELKSNRQNTLSDMRNRQQTNVDNLISQDKPTYSLRNQMIQLGKESKALDEDIRILQDTISSKTQQISNLEMEILNVSSDNDLANEVGPLKYISKITGKSLDQVVNWFIIALMLVFDPLAIALVISANFVFSYVNEKKKQKEEIIKSDSENNKSLEVIPHSDDKKNEYHTIKEEKTIFEEPLNEKGNPIVLDDSGDQIQKEESNVINEKNEVQIILENSDQNKIQRKFTIGETPISNIEEIEGLQELQEFEEELNNLTVESKNESEEGEETIIEENENSLEKVKDSNQVQENSEQSNPELLHENLSLDNSASEEYYEEDLVYSPDISSIDSNIDPTLTPEEASAIVTEEEDIEEDSVEEDEAGEFGGYKLGNVYDKSKKNIKEYKNKKEIPTDMLVRREDPTRL